uniref:helicase SWR1 isoform X3 n=1 Tax=Ciona intestinalis TaxID=7719 RepID=UPI00089DBA50|nr:helicase SWR1 isoform X3 [Ciona intestinalis]|eukprot:XP_018666729.1 helicase SWR1 isoform X3 [Ciona intestinalis]
MVLNNHNDGTPATDASNSPVAEKRLGAIAIQEEKMKLCSENYTELVTELFFLQHGGNYTEFAQFKKRPSQKLIDHLRQTPVFPNGDGRHKSSDARKASTDNDKLNTNKPETKPTVLSVETTPAASLSGNRPAYSPSRAPANQGSVQSSPKLNDPTLPASPSLTQRLKRQSRNTLSDVYEDTIGSQEEILERAKQEAVVQRRVAELRKQGLWSQRRLPKVQEPPRNKTHWDYLLEEMRWLAADFAQERKWKRAAARKVVRMVTAYHKDVREKEKRVEREGQQKLRRIAANMARQIRNFWSNIEKVVEYKQRSLLDEKRQKALDLHLNFIVDQTAKYSDWLSQGLNQPSVEASPSVSKSGSQAGSDDDFLPQGASSDDEETIAVEEKDVKEEHVLDEIALLQKESEIPFEDLLSQLPPDIVQNVGAPLIDASKDEDLPETKKEGEQIIEETLKEESPKPPEATEESKPSPEKEDPTPQNEEALSSDDESNKPTPISLRRSARKRQGDQDTEDEDAKRRKTEDNQDVEFDGEDESSSDDERTLKEQEQTEDVDHDKEIADLQAENELPIEELMKMYQGYGEGGEEDAEDEPVEEKETVEPEPEPDAKEGSDLGESSDEEAGENDNDEEEETHEEIGMDYLLKADLGNKEKEKDGEADASKVESSPNKEITDVAAEAMSLQPTGHTLATTQVVTPVPGLLKHTLREYQHIGLDWLVTMYVKRLNGILADEMGLGKTIQTIALLAHLACDKGVWGPHLIVVPTSVMLNWEMEFKKWCPGFKILTYYGSQKERKLKRTGWTKSNAFHVCITSYKLVLQDHTSFRRKKWRYLILDEAQNIKNFKSQRWQTLLNFNSQRRLLLTGTPLQNNLMELWSLMHFLMPHVFQSHREFKEWFSNPMTGMIEGSQEFNEKIVRRLHKVLRPFLLRRIKKDVEKQMPNKYEHVVRCHLSKRQRFLYDDFMSRASTRETLAGGHFMSVINVLMQLRKVCNHPNLFESRPTVSSFVTTPMTVCCPTIVAKAMEKSVFETADLEYLNLYLPNLCKVASYNVEERYALKTPKKLIEELDSTEEKKIEPLSHPANLNDRIRSMVFERLFTSPHPLQQQKNASLLATRPASRSGSPTLLQQKLTSATNVTTTKSVGKSDTTDITTSKSSTSQSITLQYQTAQGTRWATIPNGQIRHLPGGVVQIVTTGVPSRSATPVPTQAALPATDRASDTTATVERDASGSKRLPAESYSKMLARIKASKRTETLSRIARMNEQRCYANPSYLPANTIDLLSSITKPRHATNANMAYYFWREYYPTPDISTPTHTKQKSFIESDLLQQLVKLPSSRLLEMQDVLNRFTFVVPKVTSPSTKFVAAHQTPWKYYSITTSMSTLRQWLSRKLVPYHRILRNTRVQFPEVRLIEYDCGKLQVLNVLLRRFWVEKHRILIFTQMTRVLDILEAFLSYHGYRYLRLDGSTPIEQRMARMERFNNDPRIFCFILSTRSGGIGVNLTGADTVVFYDSDWNPTMDAQAQDRCHRIGQTRDVHIYRLISERTVEENILKKANQKRLLGEMAIEGGSFTTAFFKEQALKDLFNAPSGLEDLNEQPTTPRPLTARQKAIEASKTEGGESEKEKDNLEVALLETEDKEDAAAAKMLKEEQDAVLEEFTEEKVEEEDDGISERFKIPKGSRVEEELKTIYDELNPIERYALRFLELSAEELNDLELQEAESQVEQSKKDWELSHLMALKEEEEMRMDEEDEIFYTREDSEAQTYIDQLTGEIMPLWLPPTPPHDDTDIYQDETMCLLYLPVPMMEEQLPPVMKRDRKRIKMETGMQSPRKKLSRIDINIPKSLFNRPHVNLKKKEPKMKIKLAHKTKASMLSATPSKGNIPGLSTALSVSPKENGELGKGGVEMGLDWIINEDWALLQAVQQVLDMSPSLAVMMPAHTANWHLVAEMVNAVGCVYRSPKQCKYRYENVISMREDGKGLTTDAATPKKKMKVVKPLKTKPMKMQKTNYLYIADTNLQFSTLYSNRFDACKVICNKRNPQQKSTAGTGQFQRNPKHTTILQDCGIAYDKPLLPMQVAAARAKRIASQKKPTSELLATTASQPQSVQSVQPTVSITPQVGHTVIVTNGNQLVAKQPMVPGLSQLTAIPLSGGGSNIVVNNSAFTRRVNQSQAAAISLQSQGTKMATGKTSVPSLTLRTLTGAQQLQIQPQGSNAQMSLNFTGGGQSPMVTITTAVAGTSTPSIRPSVTYPSRAGTQVQKLTTMQQIRQANKQQTVTPTKHHVKQLRVTQQQPQQQQHGGVSASVTKPLLGKTVQLTKQVTPQELMLMKRRTQLKVQPQIQIAPINAQIQAQQVQSLAAQQATQSIITTKPLPITVPVTNLVSGVNLSSLNTTSSSQQKPMIVTGGQTTLNQQHLIFQQHLLKQRQIPQQQARQVIASKQPKAVYAQQLVSGTQGGTTVKMQAQVLNQLMQQQQKQRRSSNKQQQQPVTLTVTKLLQSQSPVGTTLRHTLVPQSSQMNAQQITQLPISVSTAIVTSGAGNQQQRVISQPRQPQQLPRVRQIHQMTSQPGSTPQMIVASTPIAMQRPPTVVTVSNQQTMQLQNQLLSQQVHVRNPTQTVLSPTSINLQVIPSSHPTTPQAQSHEGSPATQVVTLSTTGSQETPGQEIQYTLQQNVPR